jgi:hypothetical protein
MMGLEPTTFCMARASGDLTTPAVANEISMATRKSHRGREARSGQVGPPDLTGDLTGRDLLPLQIGSAAWSLDWRRP